LSPLKRKSSFDVLPGRGKQDVNAFDCAIMTGVTIIFFRHPVAAIEAHCIARADPGISTI
jgi:hypothetical protein